MQVINARNVHCALALGVEALRHNGRKRDSRNGPVLVMKTPVTTRYERPTERVLFWKQRDANPFLHLFESLWMLAGRRDVAFVGYFAKNFYNYSDDGNILHGAYGHRWRYWFGFDQLERIITLLTNHPDTRRAVLTMWDPTVDLRETEEGRDLPCNDLVFFWIHDGRLQMTVTCRSNDIIWGCYGSNAVHFSILQEYMAARLGLEVGEYWQISNNFHAYLNTLSPLGPLELKKGPVEEIQPDNTRALYTTILEPYSKREVKPYPLVANPKTWLKELEGFMDGTIRTWDNPFFSCVALPLLQAHQAYKQKCYKDATQLISLCEASDWRLAAQEWIQRRLVSHEQSTGAVA